MGARVAIKLDASSTKVDIFVVLFAAHVAQQTRQHRQVNLFIRGRQTVQVPTVFCYRGVQLRVRVTPLAHTPNVHKVLTQQLFVLTVAQLVLRACSRFSTTCF